MYLDVSHIRRIQLFWIIVLLLLHFSTIQQQSYVRYSYNISNRIIYEKVIINSMKLKDYSYKTIQNYSIYITKYNVLMVIYYSKLLPLGNLVNLGWLGESGDNKQT